MNKHIELVKKWLADDKSVSLEELRAAYVAADAAAYAAACAAAWADAAADAAAWADAAAYAYADYWRNEAIEHVRKYEELTK